MVDFTASTRAIVSAPYTKIPATGSELLLLDSNRPGRFRTLALYPFSHRKERVHPLIERVVSGGVSVNDPVLHVGQGDLAFGGAGESGMGHYHGYDGFLTFSKLCPVFHQASWSNMRMLEPPYGKPANRLLAFLTR